MANFKYYENDYELAVLQLLENAGWQYQCGYDIHRKNDEVILAEDLREYLCKRYDYISDDELDKIIIYLTSVTNQSLYRSMKGTYRLLMKGYNLLRDDGTTLFIDFFDFFP